MFESAPCHFRDLRNLAHRRELRRAFWRAKLPVVFIVLALAISLISIMAFTAYAGCHRDPIACGGSRPDAQ